MDSLAELFDSFRQSFACAYTQSGSEFRLSVGRYRFKLCFAAATVEHLIRPALAHLETPENDGANDFVFEIWDSASTGVPPPRAPWLWEKSDRIHENAPWAARRFDCVVSAESGTVSIFDRTKRHCIFWMADVQNLTGHERAAPLLQMFNRCFQETPLRLAHAAVVGTDLGAALLAGQSGAGKSTTAALARADGMFHLGDDYCVCAVEPPRAFAFYRSAKLHDNSLRLAPLKSWMSETAWTADDKNVFVLDHDAAPRELPLKMIVLPQVRGTGATSVRPATAAEALRALAPSTLFQLPGTKPDTFAFFAKLARGLPAFHLLLGGDAENVAKLLRNLLNDAAR